MTGTLSLVRLALRRDRILLPAWILVFIVSAASTAPSTLDVYPTLQDRIDAATNINNSTSLVALYGLVYDPASAGALATWKLGGFGAVMVSLLAIFLVIRHTRAEEESGRLELLGATVVGRYAPLTAALILGAVANIALGLVTALVLVASGLPVAGSIAFGLAWTGLGLVFAAAAALAAQLTTGARAAIGLTATAIGLFYLLRATGDTTGGRPGLLSWLSPIGWAQQVRPYAGDRWPVLGLLVLFAAALTGGAYALVARRDYGAGLLPDRPGPAAASRWLGTPLGLAWRLQRSVLSGWIAGFVVLGIVFGNMASSVDNMLTGERAREFITKLGGVQVLSDAFLATELGMAGVIASAYGIQAAMRLRSEESALRAEPVLATAVSRWRWAGSHLIVALVGVLVLMTVAGLGAGLAHAAQSNDIDQLGRVLSAALVRVPAAWVLTGLVMAAFGAAPRAILAGWVALIVFLLLGEFGPVFGLDQWLMDVSPYAHVPRLPGADLTAMPMVALTAVAAALIAGGLIAFRRRDIAS